MLAGLGVKPDELSLERKKNADLQQKLEEILKKNSVLEEKDLTSQAKIRKLEMKQAQLLDNVESYRAEINEQEELLLEASQAIEILQENERELHSICIENSKSLDEQEIYLKDAVELISRLRSQLSEYERIGPVNTLRLDPNTKVVADKLLKAENSVKSMQAAEQKLLMQVAKDQEEIFQLSKQLEELQRSHDTVPFISLSTLSDAPGSANTTILSATAVAAVRELRPPTSPTQTPPVDIRNSPTPSSKLLSSGIVPVLGSNSNNNSEILKPKPRGGPVQPAPRSDQTPTKATESSTPSKFDTSVSSMNGTTAHTMRSTDSTFTVRRPMQLLIQEDGGTLKVVVQKDKQKIMMGEYNITGQ